MQIRVDKDRALAYSSKFLQININSKIAIGTKGSYKSISNSKVEWSKKEYYKLTRIALIVSELLTSLSYFMQ